MIYSVLTVCLAICLYYSIESSTHLRGCRNFYPNLGGNGGPLSSSHWSKASLEYPEGSVGEESSPVHLLLHRTQQPRHLQSLSPPPCCLAICGSGSKAAVSNQGRVCLQGASGKASRHCQWSQLAGEGQGATGTWRVGTRDATEHPTVHRTAPLTENDLVKVSVVPRLTHPYSKGYGRKR